MFSKVAKDWLFKAYLDSQRMVPEGLVDLLKYFRQNGPIHFNFHQEEGMLVAVSENFRYGSIVTSGRDQEELDMNVSDAILTSFKVPSSYAKKAGIHREGKAEGLAYAAA